jgi:17beta-estradiol 17-dehydrogenase / very-long-chain 3-oxoacyl-CoA reductase
VRGADSGGVAVVVVWCEQKPEYFHELSDQWTYDIIQVNIKGTIRMTRIIGPFMLKQGKGGIINVSSGSGTHPTPMITMYAASKVSNHHHMP